MRLRTNGVILLMAVSLTGIAGFMAVSRGRSLGSQEQPNSAEKSEKICDPTDCRTSENKHPGDCSCRYSVILISFGETDPQLTDVQNGVDFDLNAEGRKQRVSWTDANSSAAFLYLDRNESKGVDNGLELFGNLTSQLPSPRDSDRNGFLGLAYYERPNLDGNGDGVIDSADSLFSKLRLWRDTNHNGISEPGELHSLKEIGIQSISVGASQTGPQGSVGQLAPV
jgi:hypothetical protein